MLASDSRSSEFKYSSIRAYERNGFPFRSKYTFNAAHISGRILAGLSPRRFSMIILTVEKILQRDDGCTY